MLFLLNIPARFDELGRGKAARVPLTLAPLEASVPQYLSLVPSFVTDQRHHAVSLRDIFARFEKPEFEHFFYRLEGLPHLCEALSRLPDYERQDTQRCCRDLFAQRSKELRHTSRRLTIDRP
jgi:hypothetical protein